MKQLLKLSFLLFAPFMWAQVYQNAESVEYDTVNDQWLVANGSRMLTDDGSGNLGFFGTGNASHGTEVLGNTVFSVASNRIKGYDLTTEEQVMDLVIPGVSFLNGLTNDGSNTLYVTDFSASRIYSIDVSDVDNPTFDQLIANTGDTPNGILYDGDNNRLLYVTWGGGARIKAIDLDTLAITTLVNTGLGSIDGIVRDEFGLYYISSWNPARITKYSEDLTNPETVSTPSLNSPADIGVSPGQILGIPMGTSVIFVDLKVLGTNDFDDNPLSYGVSSNPINETSFIQFNLTEFTDVSLEIYDATGKLIVNLFQQENAIGKHSVLLAGLDLSSGFYFASLKTSKGSFVEKLIVR